MYTLNLALQFIYWFVYSKQKSRITVENKKEPNMELEGQNFITVRSAALYIAMIQRGEVKINIPFPSNWQ